MLFAHQDDLGDVHEYALRVGVEIYRFEADVSSERFARKVRDDLQSGLKSGGRSTPTFFINSVRYSGEHEVEAMRAALEEAWPTS